TISAVRQRYPDAEVWVVVRRGCEGILSGCPAIDRLLTAPAVERSLRSRWDWVLNLKLCRELRRKPFDSVFELSDGDRGRWLGAVCRSKHRCTNGGGWPISRFWRFFFDQVAGVKPLEVHAVEKDYKTVKQFLPLEGGIPKLSFSPDRTQPWAPADGIDDFAFLHPATRWLRKRWPEEHWLELGRSLLQRVSRLVVSCGPDPEEIEATSRLCEQLGPKAIFTGGALAWPQLAGLLHRARLFVGVDTAAMHLAAACQCPTAAIFGPSVPWIWHPWSVRHRLVAPADNDAYSGRLEQIGEIEALRVADVSVARVLEACDELLRAETTSSPPAHPQPEPTVS
ncbi:MAG: glycosyltransferase family 9 protein, partial [Limisphaerales bacterium]